MKIGRNEPCPCGSGKKHKKCCLKLDRMAQGAGPESLAEGQVLAFARGAEVWEVDIRPVPLVFEDKPDARPANVLVVADGILVDTEPLIRPSPEPEDVAEVLERAVLRAVQRLGKAPHTVAVREETVATHLAERLAESEDPAVSSIEVDADYLLDLDEVACEMIESLTGHQPVAFYSYPNTWAGWGLPDERVAEIFRAAAAFYRAAPWKHLTNEDLIEAESPRGSVWTMVVLGNEEKEYGLYLYAFRGDAERVCEGTAPGDFWDLDGQVLSLSFEKGNRLSKQKRREISRKGWEVADAAAYPDLIAFETPAGGLLKQDAEDLIALLGVVPRFVEDEGWELVDEELPWVDPETDFELVYLPYQPDVREELRILVLRELIEPGDAQGSGANPEGALRRFAKPLDTFEATEAFLGELWHEAVPVLHRFSRHLLEVEGFGKNTVGRHTRNAEGFARYLTQEAGVPLSAVHLKDLTAYLWDWYPRKKAPGRTAAQQVPVSLERFFDYLAVEEDIVCPWAFEILAERDEIEVRWGTSPGGFWLDEDGRDWWSSGFSEQRTLLLLPEMLCLGHPPPDELVGLMGSKEALLWMELERRWLLWRDAILRSEDLETPEVLERLCRRQRDWEETVHPHLDGRTPAEVVIEERAKQEGRDVDPSREEEGTS